jgi:hypothetical protein
MFFWLGGASFDRLAGLLEIRGLALRGLRRMAVTRVAFLEAFRFELRARGAERRTRELISLAQYKAVVVCLGRFVALL